MKTKQVGLFAIAPTGGGDSHGLFSVTIVRPGHGPNAIWVGSFYGDASAAASMWRHALLSFQIDDSDDEDDLWPEVLVMNDLADLDGIVLVKGEDASTAYHSDDLDEVGAAVRRGISQVLGKPVALTQEEAEERDWSDDDLLERIGIASAADLDEAAS